ARMPRSCRHTVGKPQKLLFRTGSTVSARACSKHVALKSTFLARGCGGRATRTSCSQVNPKTDTNRPKASRSSSITGIEGGGGLHFINPICESAGSYVLLRHTLAEELELQCRGVVDKLVSEHHWQLLDRDELVRRTLGHVRAGLADRVESAAIGVYCLA